MRRQLRASLMTWLVLFVAVIGVLLAGAYDEQYISIPDDTDKQPSKTINQQLPNVEFEDLDGNKVHFDDFKNKVILLNFWASWCVPCIKEFPELLKLVDKMDGKVVLLAVSNDSNKQDIEKFLKRFKTDNKNVKILWDRDKSITQDIFHTMKLPETIIISPAQQMIRKIIGAEIDWTGEEMILSLDVLFR